MQNFITIPCPVGTVVYLKRKYSWQGDTDYIPYKITNLTITQNKKGVWTKKYRAMRLIDGKTVDDGVNFNFDDIGGTVFYAPPEVITWQDKCDFENLYFPAHAEGWPCTPGSKIIIINEDGNQEIIPFNPKTLRLDTEVLNWHYDN